MEDQPADSAPPRYRWPWFVLAAVLLGILLYATWMTVEVRRIRRQHAADPWAAPASTTTNLAR
jgi:hypothetical protein